MAETHTAESLEPLGMAELRDIGKSLELTFGPAVSKVDAREQILASQSKQTVTVEIVQPTAGDIKAKADSESLPLVRRESTGEWKCPFPGCETRDSHESKQRRCQCGAAIVEDEQVIRDAH